MRKSELKYKKRISIQKSLKPTEVTSKSDTFVFAQYFKFLNKFIDKYLFF